MDTGRYVHLSFHIGRCRVVLRFPFFVLLAVSAMFGEWSFWALVAALLHEMGHLAAVLILGGSPERIETGAAGLCICVPERYRTAPVYFAGPAANILTAVVFAPLSPRFAAINIIMGLMNLFPTPPLDGGELMQMLLQKFANQKTADRLAIAVSFSALAVLLTVGIYILLRSEGNFSLLIVGLWLFYKLIRNYI